MSAFAEALEAARRPQPKPRARPSVDKRTLSAHESKKRARGRSYRETPEVADAVGRLILAVGKRVATEDDKDLEVLLDLEVQLRKAWSLAVAGLRRSNYTDGDIGAVLGITKQAVQQRWPR